MTCQSFAYGTATRQEKARIGQSHRRRGFDAKGAATNGRRRSGPDASAVPSKTLLRHQAISINLTAPPTIC